MMQCPHLNFYERKCRIGGHYRPQCATKFYKECRRYRLEEVKDMSALEREWDLKVKVKVKDKHIIVTVNDKYIGRYKIREVIPVKDQYVLIGYFIGRVLREYDERV